MDRTKKTLQEKKFVFWEEIARDGAQAKTILSKEQRVEIAKMHSKIFGKNAPDHLVFAAGFVSIAPQEAEAIKFVANNVDECQIAVNSRSKKEEISDAINSIKDAKYPRLAIVTPANDRLSNLMLHKTTSQVFDYMIDIIKYAIDKANGIPIDLQLAAAYEGNPVQISEFAQYATELGVSTIGLGDTCGKIYPLEIKKFYEKLLANSNNKIIYAPHLHNDLGFAIDNTFEGIKKGITFACTSWLGLAERIGLARTELLTFLLTYDNENSINKLGFDTSSLFYSPPNLKLLPIIAKKVAEYTNVPLKTTDPIVGTGVNSISTGTPFVDIFSFQPFNAEKILGIKQKIFVTHLANRRLITEKAKNLGYDFNENQIIEILKIVKEKAYKDNKAIISETDVKEIFEKIAKQI